MNIWDTLTGGSGTASSPSPYASDNAKPAGGSSSQLQAPSAPSVGSFIFDSSQLHPLANINQDSLDYLTLEDSVLSDLPGNRSALPSRGWSDDLCYGTGVTYLSALTVGGAWGLVEGLNRSAHASSPKLKLNAVLNAVTRRGPFLGNSAGVVAIVYNGINSTVGHYRGKHDAVNSIFAGGLSGMIFKSTRGTRPMLISGGIVATAAGAWAFARKVVSDS